MKKKELELNTFGKTATIRRPASSSFFDATLLFLLCNSLGVSDATGGYILAVRHAWGGHKGVL